MLDGDMVVDNSPTKTISGSPNSSANSVIRSSWAEEVQLSENGFRDFQTRTSSIKLEEAEIKNDMSDIDIKREEDIGTILETSRELVLDFIEDVNEQKFERLIKEEKLKTPFKRRHSDGSSNESRSVSPNTTHSEEDGVISSHKEEKRLRHNSNTSSSNSSSSYIENDPAILMRRQKQIDYGKNTDAYERYMESIPNKLQRTHDNPRTPNKYGKYSRRAFDGLVKIWRKQLHNYDQPTNRRNTHNDISSDSD